MKHIAVLFLLASAAAAADEPYPWIRWAPTIEEAKDLAKKEKKLILAFVTPWDDKRFEQGYEGAHEVREFRPPATPPPPRDRDPGFVKERALLTTLLCDPDLGPLIARRFVAVRLRLHAWHFFHAGKGTWRDPLPRLGTKAQDVWAPALVFSTPKGKLVHQVGRLGVFQAAHVERVCRAVLAKQKRFAADEPEPDAVRRLLLEGAFADAEAALADRSAKEALARRGELLVAQGRFADARALLKGARGKDEWRQRADAAHAAAAEGLGDGEAVRKLWEGIARRARGQGPWAVRATWHLDPRGPFPGAWTTAVHVAADPLAPTTEVGGREHPVRDAVDVLLRLQGPDGAWGETNDRFGMGARGGIAVPRTALCVCALHSVREDLEGARRERVDAAVKAGAAFVRAWAKRPEPKVWDLTYALHLELALPDGAAGKKRVRGLIQALGKIENDGGWTYARRERNHTFNTAPILILLAEAQAQGHRVDPKMIERGVRFLEANRLGKRPLFHYGTMMEHMTPEQGDKAEASSCMRGPLCELALHAVGARKSTGRLVQALKIFFDHADGVRTTTKIYESFVDPTVLQDSYRYYFGTWYAARAIGRLSKSKKKSWGGKLRARILAHQEIDGSFVDSMMVGKASSTALALLTLAELG